MRLTVFLIGAALFGYGWFAGHNEATASAFNNYGQVVEADCGSPFYPERSSQFFPALAYACTSAVTPGRYIDIACLVIGGIFLIRLLYMLVGPKIPSPQP